MKKVYNTLIKRYVKYRLPRIERYMTNPIETQADVLATILAKHTQCEYGKRHGLQADFYTNCPVVEYDDIAPYIKRMMLGEKDILVPGFVKWFSKSSGTSSDVSKFIPVTETFLKNCHYRSSWDVVTMLNSQNPDIKFFEDKNLMMVGSTRPYEHNPNVNIGDISAILVRHMPLAGKRYYTPDLTNALLPDWEDKINAIINISANERVFSFAGVPTWTTVIFDRILEVQGKSTMEEVWPTVKYYLHGGVNFSPYRQRFDEYFPSKEITYIDMYNASEGYFSIQNDQSTDDMLLFLDNDIYYEFIAFDNYTEGKHRIINLADVEANKPYVMLITTSAGLWRYVLGDVVTFTNTAPYKIKITGRTKHFINVFGEEVMVHNTDTALTQVSVKHNVKVRDYTVAPIYIEEGVQGGHEWLVEFEQAPVDVEAFSRDLDIALRQQNSDYDAKRQLAIAPLKLNIAEPFTFYNWLQHRGKLGGQNKVPRLHNTRKYLEAIHYG